MSVVGFAFYLFALCTVTGGLFTVVSRNPVHSVLWLILTFLSSAGLFVLLGAEFVAMLLVIVYVGAVAVLFLFVVMMLDIKYRELQTSRLYFPVGVLIGTTVLIEVYGAFSKVFSKNTNLSADVHNVYFNWYDSIDALADLYVFGQVFYTHYVLQILIAGLILYIAVIGVAFLTVKSAFVKSKKREQSIFKQLSRKNVL